MLTAYENLGYADVPPAVSGPQSRLQLSVVGVAQVDVLGHDADAQIVKEAQHVAAVLERGANATKTGDVDHHFPPLCIALKKRRKKSFYADSTSTNIKYS